ncbi:MAG: dephospho-CoA kinase [Candidatus Omnitrophica bacterium]|nr:dephospho-CoA kinase [Candidatus Omnitrophota bacterium]
MLIVGVTGGLGTGKTTVAAMFKRHGARIIDADAVTRGLLAPKGKCIKRVAKIFPRAILNSTLNRQALASIVFQNSHTLKKLTDIVFPQALKEIQRQISLYRNKPLIILDVPLLFESGWEKIVDTTVVVKASRGQQFQRLKKGHLPAGRQGLSRADITRRLRLQIPLSEKLRRADIVIDNRGTLKETRQQVDAVVDRFLPAGRQGFKGRKNKTGEWNDQDRNKGKRRP